MRGHAALILQLRNTYIFYSEHSKVGDHLDGIILKSILKKLDVRVGTGFTGNRIGSIIGLL
jgi:hypothetical protein